jgi:hypothetical protein
VDQVYRIRHHGKVMVSSIQMTLRQFLSALTYSNGCWDLVHTFPDIQVFDPDTDDSFRRENLFSVRSWSLILLGNDRCPLITKDMA